MSDHYATALFGILPEYRMFIEATAPGDPEAKGREIVAAAELALKANLPQVNWQSLYVLSRFLARHNDAISAERALTRDLLRILHKFMKACADVSVPNVDVTELHMIRLCAHAAHQSTAWKLGRNSSSCAFVGTLVDDTISDIRAVGRDVSWFPGAPVFVELGPRVKKAAPVGVADLFLALPTVLYGIRTALSMHRKLPHQCSLVDTTKYLPLGWSLSAWHQMGRLRRMKGMDQESSRSNELRALLKVAYDSTEVSAPTAGAYLAVALALATALPPNDRVRREVESTHYT